MPFQWAAGQISIKTLRKATMIWVPRHPGQVTHTKPDVLGISPIRTIPWDEAVTSTESGGVQLKNGGNVIAFGHGHQGVHHLFLGISQPASRGVLVRVHLRRKSHRVSNAAGQSLHA